MDTKILTSKEIPEAAEIIKRGGLVAFPTETVYGLGADGTNPAAVKKVYVAKGRPSDNPLILHIASPETVYAFVDNLPEVFPKLAAKFWPGPLTMIFSIIPGSLPSCVTGGLSTAAFRMPNNKETLALIQQAETPLVGPSANTSGKPSPTSAAHVYHDLQGKIDGILDGGETLIGIESTVIDLSNYETQGAVILRPGVITAEDLGTVVDRVTLDKHLISESEIPKAPGMKYTHYAPNAEVVMVSKNDFQAAIHYYATRQEKNVALLASKQVLEKYPDITGYCLTEKHNVMEAASHLYAGLRALDEKNPPVELILAETFPEVRAGIAYMNRLKKAAGGKRFPEK